MLMMIKHLVIFGKDQNSRRLLLAHIIFHCYRAQDHVCMFHIMAIIIIKIKAVIFLMLLSACFLLMISGANDYDNGMMLSSVPTYYFSVKLIHTFSF